MSEKTDEPIVIADLAALIADVPEESIISRGFARAPHLQGTLFAFAAGEGLTEHTSSHAAVLHFIAGEADVTLGEEQFAAGPGTWMYMPPRLPHSIRARTPVRMVLLLLMNGA
jgi:quercetin dioxygenase-like cupin family protein